MTIAIDGSRAFSKDRTGTENYSYQIIKNLAKIDPDKIRVDRENQYLIYLRPGINVSKESRKWPKNFQFSIINYQKLWTQVGLAKQTFLHRADILWVPAHTLPIIRKPGLKTVVTVHDLGSQYLPKTHQLKQRLYLSLMQKVQLRGASHLITVSQATKDDLVKRIGINSKKITVIYEGFDNDLFKPVKNELLVNVLKHYDIQKGYYFLFVGTVQPRKNLERLIKAFKIFRDQYQVTSSKGKNKSLIIVGKKGWLSDDIYKLPQKLGIEDQVKFLDYVSTKDLPALYSGAIALTFPSLFEGFGLPIVEAQACGCPVLTSNVSSMPEVVGKGGILVDPYSIDDIVLGMERMMNDELRIKNIKAGFENIKRFSWQKAAKETLGVLTNV